MTIFLSTALTVGERYVKTKRCSQYCGITCVDGHCPNALDDMDRRSDTDAYAAYHLDKKLSCSKCGYYRGCEDCYFAGTDMCTKENEQ